MIRCPACGTENLDVQYACGVCSAPLPPRTPLLRAVPHRTWRRVAYVSGAVGAVLVIAAIPTDNKWIVLAGLVLVVLAHLILFLEYFVRWAQH